MELKVKTIDLFDREFLISERTAGNVIALSQMQTDGSAMTAIYQSAIVLSQGLKININRLENNTIWYENPILYLMHVLNIKKRIQKRNLKKILTHEYILDNMPASQISGFAIEVLILEGYVADKNDKKKVVKEKT